MNSAGLVWVLVGCAGSIDLGVEQTSVVDWLDVRVGKNVGWSLHVSGRREWGHDRTIALEVEKDICQMRRWFFFFFPLLLFVSPIRTTLQYQHSTSYRFNRSKLQIKVSLIKYRIIVSGNKRFVQVLQAYYFGHPLNHTLKINCTHL